MTPPFSERYKILGPLGAGRIGRVFKALDSYLDRVVAIKTTNEQLSVDKGILRALMLKEARTAAILEHPHIIRIYHLDFFNDSCYYVMEYAEDGSLRDLMQKRALQLAEVLNLMKQVCEALSFVHRKHFIHLDLKPTNLLLKKGEGIKMTDFGLAQHVKEESLPRFLLPAGTPKYMAPEGQKGDPLDLRADLYAVGVIFYELLCGEKPAEPLKSNLTEEMSLLTGRTGSEELSTLILKCLNPEPKKRPKSVRELLESLEKFA